MVLVPLLPRILRLIQPVEGMVVLSTKTCRLVEKEVSREGNFLVTDG